MEWYRTPPTVIFCPIKNKRYHFHGEMHHRTDGPAVECVHQNGSSDGINEWYVRGRRHRTDGPAITRRDVDSYYFEDFYLGDGANGFWKLWDILTPEQRDNFTLLSYLPNK